MRPVRGLAILSLNPSLQMKLTDDYAAGNTDAHKSPVDERYRLFTTVTVAVGTIITDRPPHRSVRARLRIRLLRRMSGVEACIGIGVQNAGWRNPPVQDWGKTCPTHLRTLTAADQNTLP